MERARGEIDWAQADQFVEFCQLHRLRIKGHALVWHTQMPSWVDDALPAWKLRAALLNRVTTLVSRYKGIVRAWDVMNEATADKTDAELDQWLQANILVPKLCLCLAVMEHLQFSAVAYSPACGSWTRSE